ncbi:malate synthase G [Sphingomonas bacterium]|uniref:malate synthase G n=1 Tax=Sphingomonas bacterium TaxID=1895847 RepID=UPI001575238D|nr:malate synthase G [Sphingomonas bacterium]
MVERAGLLVDARLAAFIEGCALPGTSLQVAPFWSGVAALFARFAPENAALLGTRDEMQVAIDAWHRGHPDRPIAQGDYQAFLRSIGYLVSDPAPFEIAPDRVDEEVAQLAGPQLVVPVLNARFLLNAANARWGSLYDALYGTDAVAGAPPAGGYDRARGNQVVGWTKAFLDEVLPLTGMRWADLTDLRVLTGDGATRTDADPERLLLGIRRGPTGAYTALKDETSFVGHTGEPDQPRSLLFRHHGLHIELVIDRDHPIGRHDPAGIADILLESALTTIVDFEDSVAAVDAADKVAAYANWLGVIRGDLQASVSKGEHTAIRTLAPDRAYTGADGAPITLPGRSLLFVRTVGHLMTTPAVLLPDGGQAPEGILDGIVTSLIALHDLKGLGHFRNSRAGSIYIVKPKMHGPDEVAFTDRLFDAIEDLLGLERHTIKVGIMDEERRTSANLAACIHAVRNRVVFINTGFLDRTGDEIHTIMQAGPVMPKGEIRQAGWIGAYEDRNVQIGLRCGFAGRAQIGKGMWAAPDEMKAMLAQKVAHPRSGATTAWVPSPTAATLHATHYHRIDVQARQAARQAEPVTALDALLTPPLAAPGRNWTADEVDRELDNNVQGILGYVVRWIDQGVGCSKVPDIDDVGLMEDRATLRISSQHIANWLCHGVATAAQVNATFDRMAAKVDAQNATDPRYRPLLAPDGPGLAFRAAKALVFEGMDQSNGYTEPLLHHYRALAKASDAVDLG